MMIFFLLFSDSQQVMHKKQESFDSAKISSIVGQNAEKKNI
jgi:hypothetical protein